jgi:hypothetical protein
MKKLIIPILLLLSVTAFSQKTVKPVIPVKDTVEYRDSFPPIPDSINMMNQRQIGEIYKYVMDNMSASDFEKVSKGMEIAFRMMVEVGTGEFNSKRKPIKVPVKK